jgi:hypothetical protein
MELSKLIMKDFVLISPLQLIVFEYTYPQCDECKLYFEELYECSKCKTIRCKFHHYVCSVKDLCISCYTTTNIKYAHMNFADHKLYICQCGANATHSDAENITFYCSQHATSYCITYGYYCTYKEPILGKCPGTGYFYSPKLKNKLCIVHKKLINDENIRKINSIQF